MKKVLSIVLSVMLTLSLVACGGNNATENKTEGNNTKVEDTNKKDDTKDANANKDKDTNKKEETKQN